MGGLESDCSFKADLAIGQTSSWPDPQTELRLNVESSMPDA
jgi:hypothetical protein